MAYDHNDTGLLPMENTDLKVYGKARRSTQLGVCILDVVHRQAPFFCIHI